MSDFIAVVEPQVAAEQVHKQMQCTISYPIDRIKGWDSRTFYAPNSPPGPELVGRVRVKTLGLRIPKPKVHLDGQGHVRIVVIAFPSPTGLADHRGEMICPRPAMSMDGFESKRGDAAERRSDRIRWAVDVDVVLRTV